MNQYEIVLLVPVVSHVNSTDIRKAEAHAKRILRNASANNAQGELIPGVLHSVRELKDDDRNVRHGDGEQFPEFPGAA